MRPPLGLRQVERAGGLAATAAAAAATGCASAAARWLESPRPPSAPKAPYPAWRAEVAVLPPGGAPARPLAQKPVHSPELVATDSSSESSSTAYCDASCARGVLASSCRTSATSGVASCGRLSASALASAAARLFTWGQMFQVTRLSALCKYRFTRNRGAGACSGSAHLRLHGKQPT